MKKKSNLDRSSSTHHAAVVLGSKGGEKGGPERAKALSPVERSSIARKGGEAKAKGGK